MSFILVDSFWVYPYSFRTVVKICRLPWTIVGYNYLYEKNIFSINP